MELIVIISQWGFLYLFDRSPNYVLTIVAAPFSFVILNRQMCILVAYTNIGTLLCALLQCIEVFIAKNNFT